MNDDPSSLPIPKGSLRIETPINTLITMPTEQELVRDFEVLTLGTTIIINRQGSISYRDDGPTPYNKLRDEIERIL